MSFKLRPENFAHALKWILLLDVIAVFTLGAATYNSDALGIRADSRNQAAASSPLLSRKVLEITEGIIQQSRPTPPEAAREYAYVASAYEGVLETDGQAPALAAAQTILVALYPDRKTATTKAIDALYGQSKLSRPTTDPATTSTVKALLARMKTDGHSLTWNGIIPTGTGKWVKTTSNPMEPRAGDWQRWQASGSFNVPPPPQYGSATDTAELAKVKAAVSLRDGAWIAKINFWGGTPGTNSPSGIWQDQFYKTIQPDLSGTALQRDRSYAYAQKILAQTLADSFMECWKVKYTYWTGRPDMHDPSIITGMPDPLFPGYVSGHSTVSKAAAEVLAVMAPAHASGWRQMAVDAKDSRLYAGIHFDNDNIQGFALGQAIAQQAVVKRKLDRIF